jgi:Domain of unknown function DUF29
MLRPMGNLYDQDLVLWSEEQGRALRAAAGAGWNAPIDWENVAEEIESLGKSERRALASRIAVVIEHLLKLQASPAAEPARGWRDTIRRTRQKIEEVLEESPSLRHEVVGLIVRQTPRARALVHTNFQDYGQQPGIDIESVTYTEAQVLGDWLPENA